MFLPISYWIVTAYHFLHPASFKIPDSTEISSIRVFVDSGYLHVYMLHYTKNTHKENVVIEMKKRLGELGLGSNEIDAYLYLLVNGSGKPAIIAKEIGILRSNIYGVLDRLRDYGLIEEMGGFKSKVYSAGSVEKSLNRLIQWEKDRVEKKVHIASELSGLLQGLQSGGGKGNPVDVFKYGAHSASAIKHLFDIAEKEILSIIHPPYVSSRFHINADQEEHDSDDIPGYLTEEPVIRGYKMHSIYQISDISLASFRLLLRTTLPNGVQVRVAKETPAKLLIVDREYIAMGLTSPETGLPVEETVLIHNAGIAEMLAASFFDLFNRLTAVTSIEQADEIYRKVREGTPAITNLKQGEVN